MNQDQKKYFRERINAIAQSKIVELKKSYKELEQPDIDKYLTKKNFKPNFDKLFTDCDKGSFYISEFGCYKDGFEIPNYVLFDLTEYNKNVKQVEQINSNMAKIFNTVSQKITVDANVVIDAVMFADEAEALKQLKLFTEKEYKL